MSLSEPVPDPPRSTDVDFGVDELDADDAVHRDFFHQVGVHADMLVPLAEHHSGANSYYVLFDRSATYGDPGDPQYLAVHLQRDPAKRTFAFEQAPLPLPSMAQSWLIHRGCPPDHIGLDSEMGTSPADDSTRALEQRLARDGDHFAMGYSYTSDHPTNWVTVVALRALDERAPSPFRVIVEEVNDTDWTHTLREGGFATVEEALQWCSDRLTGTAGPLPPVRPTVFPTGPVGMPKGPAVRQAGRSR